jgi:hypothetical protein
MPAGTDQTMYHLTPRGWEAGDASEDRVETWQRSVIYDRVSWRCVWVNLGIALGDRDDLRFRYRAFMV